MVKSSSNARERAPVICSIEQCPEWLELVAKWHHEEWMRDRSLESEAFETEHYEKRLATLRRHLESTPIPSTFLAFFNGEPIGSASIVYYQFTSQQQRTEWLTNIYVMPTFRNQGVGEQLIRHACEFARQEGVNSLRLYTRDKGRFYQKRGWVAMGNSHVQGESVELLFKRLAPKKIFE